MSRNLAALSLATSLIVSTAFADVPRVATDIAPVHSMVARVMQGLGAPSLIVAPGATPHEYSLRPSEASALQDADLVFWVSPDLTPWLEDAIATLAEDATITELLETEGTLELAFRESALFEPHVEDEHDDHDDHHDEHADAHESDHGHEDHAHGKHDPHAWLSPENGAVWLDAIAAKLALADPENADTYRSNAAAGRAELEELKDEVETQLATVRNKRFVVFHDAYQYFETSFDFYATGAISVSDAVPPSPARIAEIQHTIAERQVDCVLSEPQFDPGILAAVMDGTDFRTGVLDPLGVDLETGPQLYPQLLRNLATALADCLKPT